MIALLAILAWGGPAQEAAAALAAGAAPEATALLAPHLGKSSDEWALYSAALRAEGLPYAALLSATEALRRTPSAPMLHEALALAEVDRAHLGEVLLALPTWKADPADQEAASWLAARAALDAQSWGAAQRHLGAITKDNPNYPQAQLLLGVALAQADRPRDALVPLLIASATAPPSDPALAAAITLNLARATYATGDFPSALAHYQRVPRRSEPWAQAQFEAAWAAFREDDFGLSLGLMMTHETPFFAQGAWPEAALLRTYAHFSLCQYSAAAQVITAFDAQFRPEKTQLDALDLSLDGAWALLDAPQPLPVRLQAQVAADTRLARVRAARTAGSAELPRLDGLPGGKPAAERLRARLDALERAEAQRWSARWTAARSELAQMLNDAAVLRLDTMRLEADMYAAGGPQKGIQQGAPAAPPGGAQIWPFEGEYWADELGYFRVTPLVTCHPSGSP